MQRDARDPERGRARTRQWPHRAGATQNRYGAHDKKGCPTGNHSLQNLTNASPSRRLRGDGGGCYRVSQAIRVKLCVCKDVHAHTHRKRSRERATNRTLTPADARGSRPCTADTRGRTGRSVMAPSAWSRATPAALLGCRRRSSHPPGGHASNELKCENPRFKCSRWTGLRGARTSLHRLRHKTRTSPPTPLRAAHAEKLPLLCALPRAPCTRPDVGDGDGQPGERAAPARAPSTPRRDAVGPRAHPHRLSLRLH